MAIVLGLQVGFAWPQQKRVERVSHGADTAARDLDVLGELLERLEREPFTSPRLVALQRQLDSGGVVRLARDSRAASPGRAARLAAQPLLPDPVAAVHVGHARRVGDRGMAPRARPASAPVARARSASSRRSPRCRPIDSSIPDDPFPEIVEPSASERAGIFDGRGLGHPLLPAARSVRNDVACVAPTQLLVVSGSNMSGKSTLLRTVGINAVLALAGAPVRAHVAAALAARRSARRCASRTRCRKAARASTRRSPASARSPTSRADRRRCCSCSTSCFTAPTRTTAWSARRACCAACSIAAPSA